MEVYVYVLSAFSKGGKGGNRAGVVLDRPDLTDEQKMAAAKALGYSETAFVTASDRAAVKLEYFTPTEEVPLCGHATIASFTLLHLLGRLRSRSFTMETKAGLLNIEVSPEGEVRMEQNRPVYGEILPPEVLAPCVDASVICPGFPVQIVSTGLRDILLPVASREQLAALRPDMEAMTNLSREYEVTGVHAFALAEKGEVTAFCRNFAPLVGIEEESATGTSNCALACYLAKHQGRKERYIFEQGYELGAPSRITVDLRYQDQAISGVYVGGVGYLVEEKTLIL